jgi:mannosyltransferase
MTAPGTTDRPTPAERLLVLEACAVMAAYGLWNLGARSFWLDEGATALGVNGSPDEFADRASREPYFTMYFAIVRLFTRVSESELWVRLPSALLAVATVPLVYAVARRLFGPRAAGISLALFVVNGFVVGYAREARPYALLLFTSTLATLCFLRAVDGGSGRLWAGWAFSCVLLAFTHPVGMAVVGAHLLILFMSWRWLPRRVVLRTTALCAAGATALAYRLLQIHRDGIAWIPEPDGELVARVAQSVAGGDGQRGLAVAGFTALLLVGGAVRAEGEPRAPWRWAPFSSRWSTAMVLCWALFPFLATLAVSFSQPLLVARYVIFVAPALAVVAAAGLSRLPLPAAVAGAAAVVALLVPRTTALPAGLPQDWRALAAAITEAPLVGDTYVATPFGSEVLRYYLSRQLGEPQYDLPVFDDHSFDRTFATSTTACLDRVWLVVVFRGGGGRAGELLARTHQVAEVNRFIGLEVREYEPLADPSTDGACP